MTVNANELRDQLRAAADKAAFASANYRAIGHNEEADFHMGRQAAFLSAIHMLTEAEDAKASELEEELARNIQDEQLGEEAVRLGVIGYTNDGKPVELPVTGYGQGVDLAAVERLEEFARNAGGAVDMASGTVYSDADEGL